MKPHQMRLGKLTPAKDPRTLRLASYLQPGLLPAALASLDYSAKVRPWPMFANDRYGDCTIAGAAHMIELWGALEGQVPVIKDVDVLRVYNRLSPNDQGCVELDVLKYWRKTGIAGHKLFGFASVDPHDHDHVKLSLQLFGGVYLGIALPTSAQAQTGPGLVWDVGGAAGGWGGHCVPVVQFDADGLTVVTWGALQKMTWAFHDAYTDESYALLTQDWAVTPKASGIDYAKLKKELAQVAG